MRMSRPIEDYALIGDLHSAALVARDGSVDWLCLPRFDSEACFAALLGDDRHGHWRICPVDGSARVRRRYQSDTLVLETEFSTGSGVIRLTDCMPPRDGDPVLVRMVEGVSGSVDVRMTLAARFEYGSAQPRIHRRGGAYAIAAGPEVLWLFGPVHLRRSGGDATAEFVVQAGQRVPFAAVWRRSRSGTPEPPAVPALIAQTAAWWRDWVAGLDCAGEWRDAVTRSLITIKALSYAPTGGVVGAPTTSLPRLASGASNWDYRYCWLRDIAATLGVLLRAGAHAEAAALLDWMIRAVSGAPGQVQSLYGVAGERRLPEIELDWLPGYEGARPVRIGNAAAAQPQIGSFGEVLTALLTARMAGLSGLGDPWLSEEVLGYLQARWRDPDPGPWEARGPDRQFVHSKMMVWAAADAAIRMIEQFGDAGPGEQWRRLRADVRADVLDRGYHTGGQQFVQSYGSSGPDASLARIPLLGFLPAGDERVTSTLDAIERGLDQGGVLLRYAPELPDSAEPLGPGEPGYLPASFWLAHALALAGRAARARQVFTGLLALRNDVGLLAEAYDPLRGALAGNYPLTASHVALAAAAAALDQAAEPAGQAGAAAAAAAQTGAAAAGHAGASRAGPGQASARHAAARRTAAGRDSGQQG
jgi:GH15 family glucan-1,4-alpha-glucosidase